MHGTCWLAWGGKWVLDDLIWFDLSFIRMLLSHFYHSDSWCFLWIFCTETRFFRHIQNEIFVKEKPPHLMALRRCFFFAFMAAAAAVMYCFCCFYFRLASNEEIHSHNLIKQLNSIRWCVNAIKNDRRRRRCSLTLFFICLLENVWFAMWFGPSPDEWTKEMERSS